MRQVSGTARRGRASAAVKPAVGAETGRSLPDAAAERRHLLTVVLEDYFQVAPMKNVVSAKQWYRFESRLEANTRKTLDILDEYGIKATFFVLGWIGDELPDVVREVVLRGHEVASKGYFHRDIRQLDRDEFRYDLLRSRDALEIAGGSQVQGYRIAHGWFGPEDLWALDVLAQEGFAYDSSVRPIFRRFAAEPARRFPHLHRAGSAAIWEFPLSTWSVAGWSLPIAGGNYLRQLPESFMRRAIARWNRQHTAPFLMYFHVWELDPDQPRIQAAPLRERIRQYRNLDKMERIVRGYLERYRFSGIGEYLRLHPTDRKTPTEAVRPPRTLSLSAVLAPSPLRPRDPVSVVVPCFNEELVLPYLANTLKSVAASLAADYELRFVFVDDGSSDNTWEALKKSFGSWPGVQLVAHGRNRGVAAAILSGIRRAETEIVCSIDCDCTYDPHQLQAMIPMLREGVAMVTASPYHRDGEVRNVPAWRLTLSRGLSFLYRRVLRQDLATYTSCFRVYRRSAVVGLPVRTGGFLGVAEMLGLLDLAGGRIVECPAVLEVRLLGTSKMKILKTSLGHLALLGRLLAARWRLTFAGGDAVAGEPASPLNTDSPPPQPPHRTDQEKP